MWKAHTFVFSVLNIMNHLLDSPNGYVNWQGVCVVVKGGGGGSGGCRITTATHRTAHWTAVTFALWVLVVIHPLLCYKQPNLKEASKRLHCVINNSFAVLVPTTVALVMDNSCDSASEPCGCWIKRCENRTANGCRCEHFFFFLSCCESPATFFIIYFTFLSLQCVLFFFCSVH